MGSNVGHRLLFRLPLAFVSVVLEPDFHLFEDLFKPLLQVVFFISPT